MAYSANLGYRRTSLDKDGDRARATLSITHSTQHVEGMVVAESLPDDLSFSSSEEAERLADSGACRHVCTNLSLMWNVHELVGFRVTAGCRNICNLNKYSISRYSVERASVSERRV